MADEGFSLEFGQDGIAVLTLCKGQNKFNRDYIDAWNRTLDKIERNTNCTALVTTGSDQFFSVGLDLAWLQKQTPAILDEYHDRLHELYRRILSLHVPTVALINGHAFAEGAFIALMHDIRVMRSDRGWISWPEVQLKLPMTSTMLELFRLKLPQGNVQREAILFGKRFNAQTAMDLGIVDAVADKDDLMSEGRKLLASASGKSGLSKIALQNMKSDIYERYLSDNSKL